MTTLYGYPQGDERKECPACGYDNVAYYVRCIICAKKPSVGMTTDCVIRNIPNWPHQVTLANGLTRPGLKRRNRGRGPRVRPAAGTGGEYQDLPMPKSPRFSAYYQGPSLFGGYGDCLNRSYFDYVGLDFKTGKMRLRAGVKTW